MLQGRQYFDQFIQQELRQLRVQLPASQREACSSAMAGKDSLISVGLHRQLFDVFW